MHGVVACVAPGNCQLHASVILSSQHTKIKTATRAAQVPSKREIAVNDDHATATKPMASETATVPVRMGAAGTAIVLEFLSEAANREKVAGR